MRKKFNILPLSVYFTRCVFNNYTSLHREVSGSLGIIKRTSYSCVTAFARSPRTNCSDVNRRPLIKIIMARYLRITHIHIPHLYSVYSRTVNREQRRIAARRQIAKRQGYDSTYVVRSRAINHA